MVNHMSRGVSEIRRTTLGLFVLFRFVAKLCDFCEVSDFGEICDFCAISDIFCDAWFINLARLTCQI